MPCEVLKNAPGTSGSTFWGMLSVLENHKGISFLVGENVLEVGKLDSASRVTVIQELHRQGWQCVMLPTQALDYGSVVSRPRIFVIAAHRQRLGWSEETTSLFLAGVQSTMGELVLPRGSFVEADFVLPYSHELVQAELKLCSSSRPTMCDESTDWQGKLADLLTSMGRTWSDCYFPLCASSPWLRCSPRRERMALGSRSTFQTHTFQSAAP